MIPFKLNNQIYDIPEELAEQFKLDNPDAFLIEEQGKKKPTPQQGAETVDVTEAPDTVSRLENFSLDLQEENNLNEFFFDKCGLKIFIMYSKISLVNFFCFP